MKTRNIFNAFLCTALASQLFVACTPDDSEHELGPKPEATFTVDEVSGETNTYMLTNTTDGAFISSWNLGDGNGFANGDQVITAYFPDQGSYDVQLFTLNNGGMDTSDVQTIVVETTDPVAGNLVMGSKMDEDALDYWTTFGISDGVSFTLADGKLTAKGGNWGHAGVYQAIDVVADKQYKFAMNVSGSGASDVWFEVYFGTEKPVDGQDYSSATNQLALNTWAGCGNSEFNGNLANIACEGALMGEGGLITFEESGTIYLVVKTGGADLGTTGISIDNVELRGTK
ncbi:MAG: hypothetical protein CMO01_16335 [Thalassobius sp.]|nr:hypothetical protein [Thalassovita sp.]